MTQKERAQLIERAMRLVWASLETHLRYTHERHHDSASHHRASIREYAEVLKILASLL